MGFNRKGNGISTIGAIASVTGGSQSIPNTTSTALTFPVTDYTSGVTHSGTQFTVPENGVYLLSANAHYNADSTGLRSIGYTVNGGAVQRMSNLGAVSSAPTRVAMSAAVFLTAGDIVTFNAEQSSGAGLIVATAAGSVIKV